MSRQSISSFVEGEKIQTSLLITQMNKGITNSGAPYLSFVMQDQSGSIDAKLWDAKEEFLVGIEAGKVVLVSAEVLKYRNATQLRIYSLTKLEDNQYEPSDYVMATELSLDFMQKRIGETLLAMQDIVYRDV